MAWSVVRLETGTRVMLDGPETTITINMDTEDARKLALAIMRTVTGTK